MRLPFALLTTMSAVHALHAAQPLLPRRRIPQCTATSNDGDALTRQELRQAILVREREIKREARDAVTGVLTTVELEVLDSDIGQILQASDLNGDGKIQSNELQLALAQWEELAAGKVRALESEPPRVGPWKVAGELLGGTAAISTRRALDEELQLERAARLVELPVMFSDEDDGSFDFERWYATRFSACSS